ncbi:MAG TPA: PEP-CTERM sorting domain-containing protein [Terriglobales bacterium]
MHTRKLSLAVTALLVVFLALAASATVIDQSADAVNNTLGWTSVGQTFVSPGGALNSWQFWLGSTVPTISFYVCAGDVQAGCSSLYSTTLTNVGGGSVTVSGLSVGTTAGNLYSVLYDLNGYGGPSVLWNTNSYPGQAGWGEWGYNGVVSWPDHSLGTGFIATFGPTTPEPGTLALLGSGMLAGLGMLRRKMLL